MQGHGGQDEFRLRQQGAQLSDNGPGGLDLADRGGMQPDPRPSPAPGQGRIETEALAKPLAMPAGNQDKDQEDGQQTVKDHSDEQSIARIQSFLSGNLLWYYGIPVHRRGPSPVPTNTARQIDPETGIPSRKKRDNRKRRRRRGVPAPVGREFLPASLFSPLQTENPCIHYQLCL